MIKLTATREAVLREVPNGTIRSEYSHGSQSGRTTTNAGGRTVDAVVRFLHGAGLIARGPATRSPYVPRQWILTKDGEAWLAAHVAIAAEPNG